MGKDWTYNEKLIVAILSMTMVIGALYRIFVWSTERDIEILFFVWFVICGVATYLIVMSKEKPRDATEEESKDSKG